MKPNKHPETALIRELREKISYGIAIDAIHDVVFHAYPDFDLYMLVYASRIIEGRPHAIEVAEIAWVEPQQLPALDLLPADYPLARKLAAAA